MKRSATVSDILQILRHHSIELQKRLAISPLQLTMPTDGKGVRIKVSVQQGQQHKLPRMIEFPLGDDMLNVPLEVQEDYQEYKLLHLQSRGL